MKALKAQAEDKGYHWIDWNVCAEDATASHPDAAQILRNIRREDVYKRQGPFCPAPLAQAHQCDARGKSEVRGGCSFFTKKEPKKFQTNTIIEPGSCHLYGSRPVLVYVWTFRG